MHRGGFEYFAAEIGPVEYEVNKLDLRKGADLGGKQPNLGNGEPNPPTLSRMKVASEVVVGPRGTPRWAPIGRRVPAEAPSSRCSLSCPKGRGRRTNTRCRFRKPRGSSRSTERIPPRIRRHFPSPQAPRWTRARPRRTDQAPTAQRVRAAGAVPKPADPGPLRTAPPDHWPPGATNSRFRPSTSARTRRGRKAHGTEGTRRQIPRENFGNRL